MPLQAAVASRLAEGDRDGAATLVIQALTPPVLRYLRSLLRAEDDAADALSQWAENVWRGLPTYRGTASLKTWSLRLARNAALNFVNEAWRRHGQRLASGQASALAQSIRTRSVVVAERRHQALDELRAQLDEEDRSLLCLKLDQELSWKEVAEVLAAEGTPVEPATLMKRFERVKARLGRLARERGLLGD
jgi:RNA polymerase sigma-70 factor (ECF subfamily)